MSDRPSIRFYDSYRAEKVDFAPADPGRVTVYCCGPTVYSVPHIGNARAAVAADLAVRLLRHDYGEDAVVYARNLTDIDDKIMAAARAEGVPIGTIAERATAAYHRDVTALGCLPPDHEPRATAHVGDMQALVTRLIERGHAYAAEGHVLFDVGSFDEYGRLSKLDGDSIVAGARVEVAPYKRKAADFVLWKPSSPDEPGWAPPAGWGLAPDARGRPGWHLECSAMIEAVLGAPIDLHMGGQDLRFPHHENEVAQSCCAADLAGVPLARVWLHNGMLRLGDGKMAKSKGNVITPAELTERWPGEVVRFALLSAQYRQPLEWSEDLLTASRAQLDRFYRTLADAPPSAEAAPDGVLAAMRDDLNTPAALAALHEAREAASGGDPAAAGRLRAGGRLLGLFGATTQAWFQGGGSAADDARIEAMVAERQSARAARDFARADAIRDQLDAEGIVIEDGPDGATWRRS